jgi:large subunit ribosomal protein L4
MNLTTYTKTGNVSKTPLTVNEAIFDAPVNEQILAQAIRVYLSNQRQGTSKVKTRSNVARTKKKWFKQKGTGNARHGSRNANIFVGGGVAHGPTGLENWSKKLTQRIKHQALISALSAQQDQIAVSDGLQDLSGKTKDAAAFLNKISAENEKVLVVMTQYSDEAFRSLRNIENVLLTKVTHLNAYEVAFADKIIFTSDAVKELEARLSGSISTKQSQ